MERCRIFIVRHSQTIGNVEKRLTGRKDYELTNDGKIYIELLTQALKNIKFDKMYSSTSKRTRFTIEPLAKINRISIIELEDLCEMYFGEYDGWKWEDVNKVNPQIHHYHLTTNEIIGIKNQETTSEVADRMYNCIYKIAKSNPGKTILVCSHGVAIEAFLRKITNKNFIEEKEKYCQYNTSINELYFENDTFHIMKLGSIEHIKNYSQ